MSKRYLWLLLVLGMLPVILLTGWGHGQCQSGVSETSSSVSVSGTNSSVSVSETSSSVSVSGTNSSARGRIAYCATTYTGVHQGATHVQAGQTIALSYEAQVQKGELSLTLRNPSGQRVWETSLNDEGSDTVEYVAKEGGQHTILVEGQNTGGSFVVSWEVR